MKVFLYLLLLGSLVSSPVLAQLGMGGTPHSSAVLDLKSPANDKAFYPPRLTSVQRKAIVNPQPGAMVFDIDKGTLYLYDQQNWSPLAITATNNLIPIDRTASDGAQDDYFGFSVALAGDYALVGAIGDDSNQGSAYVFVRTGNGWTQQAKLIASDGESIDNFGFSVALAGDYALVGAKGDNMGANASQGSAYVFVRSGTTWTQQAKLTASDGAANDLFGFSVALAGDYALVGSTGDDIGSNASQGSAYVFVRTGTTWTQQAKLTASDGAADDYFGFSVAIWANYALVGAYADDIGGNASQGSAYVFLRTGTTWTQQAKFMANDGAADDNFGFSVAISGGYAIVGAYADDIGANVNQGSAYMFERTGATWTQQAKLTASDGAANDRFGSSVAISGNSALAGAINDDIGSNADQGSAYLFKRAGSAWPQARQVADAASSDTNNGRSVGLSNGLFIIGGPGFQGLKGKVSFGTID